MMNCSFAHINNTTEKGEKLASAGNITILLALVAIVADR